MTITTRKTSRTGNTMRYYYIQFEETGARWVTWIRLSTLAAVVKVLYDIGYLYPQRDVRLCRGTPGHLTCLGVILREPS